VNAALHLPAEADQTPTRTNRISRWNLFLHSGGDLVTLME